MWGQLFANWKNIDTVKKVCPVSCQTGIDQLEMEELVKNVTKLQIEVLWNKLNNKVAMKCALFMDNLLQWQVH